MTQLLASSLREKRGAISTLILETFSSSERILALRVSSSDGGLGKEEEEVGGLVGGDMRRRASRNVTHCSEAVFKIFLFSRY